MMPKTTKNPQKAGPQGVGNRPKARVFDPVKVKGPPLGKGLVQVSKRLQVPGKGRAR